MQQFSPLRVLLVTGLAVAALGWFMLPQLREQRLVGMGETREAVVSAVAFAKEYALVTGVDMSHLKSEIEYYEAIRPFVRVKGLNGPTKTELLQLTGLTEITVGPPNAPVISKQVDLIPGA